MASQLKKESLLASNTSLWVKSVQHPFSFAVLVLSLVILLVWWDQRVPTDQRQAMPGGAETQTMAPINLSPPNTSNSGRTQPKVLDNLNGGSQRQAAGAIGDLVSRLEEKVKSEPGNSANRLLLGQTYKELGRVDEAKKVLGALRKDDPENTRALMVLASIFSQSDNPQEVTEALTLLSKLSSNKDIPEYMIQMYTGDALSRQNNQKEALAQWKQALTTMPEKNPFYRVVEQRVMELSAKESANP